MRSVSFGREGAVLITWAIAWADSSAGMMPSFSASVRKAARASSSAVEMKGDVLDNRMPVKGDADLVDVRAALAALVRGDAFVVIGSHSVYSDSALRSTSRFFRMATR